MRAQSLRLVFIALCVALVIGTGCASLPGAKPNTTPSPARTVGSTASTDDAALEAAARQAITTIATVDYRQPDAWKKSLNAISGTAGQTFWQSNADRMFADVLAHKRTTEKVTIDRVVIAERQRRADAQGQPTIGAAAVLVTGRVVYADDLGRHDEPINQPLLMADLDGAWKFVALVSPSLLSAPTLSPVKK